MSNDTNSNQDFGPSEMGGLRPPIYVEPSTKIPDSILADLKRVNGIYSKNRNFPEYKKNLEEIFHVKAKEDTTALRNYLGGFIAGDGSLNVSAKKEKNAKFGIVLDPEFSATQHINGIGELINILSVLKTGRISHKSGSNATMVYTIGARQSLVEKVVPFYEQYVCPHCSPLKRTRFEDFKKLLMLFEDNAHTDKQRFINEMFPLWHIMRMQTGQINQTFETLTDAQQYVRNHRPGSR